jgi:hypothetical protein
MCHFDQTPGRPSDPRMVIVYFFLALLVIAVLCAISFVFRVHPEWLMWIFTRR